MTRYNFITNRCPQDGACLIGFPTEAAVQMKAQRIFLATQIVLVILGETIVPGAIGIIHPGTINDPMSIPQVLAPDLVKGSNFCMQYMTLDSLGHFSLYLLEGESYMRVRFKSLFDNTPRKILHHQSNIHELKWCKAFPEITIFGVAGE